RIAKRSDMIATTLRQLARFVAPLIVIIAFPAGAWAADASPWDGDARASLRLIAGSRANDATALAGLEIKAAPGWETYLRDSGDSGVPPRFDFAGSQNVKSIEIAWPAPHRFTDESGATIGYKDVVVFPLHIVPQNATKPVLLRLKADYAVCEKI